MSKIDEIRTRLESLKDESWKAGVEKDKFEIVGSDDCITCNNMKNIDFISHSREDILYLLSEIERLTSDALMASAEAGRLRLKNKALEAALRDYAPCGTCYNKGNICDHCDDLYDKWKFDEWQWRRKDKK